ncbi:MAG: hypothetical protein FGF53_03850, partial [Candidatus Brockarchaeota archaeon]|nr:hypothetical protein [Candidatus Brockarchaeota archaeon]
VASFDIKRIFIEDPKTVVRKGICKMLHMKLARISRGAFNSRYIKGELIKWEKPPPVLRAALGKWCSPYGGFIFKVCFEFGGKEHQAEFYSNWKYLYMVPLIERINELIKDTGYQYYGLHNEDIILVVLREDEAEKLKKERGWALYLPQVKTHA